MAEWRIAESVEVIDGGIESSRLSRNRQGMSLALMNRSSTAIVAHGSAQT